MTPIPDALKSIKERFDFFPFFITLAVSAIGGGVAMVAYVNAQVRNILEIRMHPYEAYLAANADFSNATFDNCIIKLRPIIMQMDDGKLPEVDKGPFHDLFIACIRDSSNPQAYSATIKKIEAKLLRGDIQSYSWHSGALGHYYLRAGQYWQAESHFKEAIGQFAAEENRTEEADSHWCLAIIALVQGNPKLAAEHYGRAAQLSPGTFPFKPSARFISDSLGEAKLQYIVSSGQYKESIPEFLQIIAKNRQHNGD